MTIAGVTTTNVSNTVPVSDEVLVNSNGSTGLQRSEDLATQLAAQGLIRTKFSTLEGQVAGVTQEINGLQLNADSVTKALWTDLAAMAGTRSGQLGRCTADAGTHTDPVVGGTVSNKGEYSWSVSPAGWQRVGDLIDPAAVSSLQVDVAAIEGSVTDEGSTARAGWAAPVIGPDGDAAAGLYVDGEWYAAGSHEAPMASVVSLTDGAATSTHAHIVDGLAERRVSISESAVRTAKVARPGLVRYGCADGSIRYASYCGPGNETAPDTGLRVILYFGQSVSVGGVQSSAQAYLANPLADMAGRIKMWSQGIAPAGAAAATMASGDFTSLVPAYEQVLNANFGETGMLSMAWFLNGAPGRGYGSSYLVASFGKGNTAYAGLKKGTVPYTNLINSLTALPAIATAAGYSAITVDAIVWDQGENDLAASEATYAGYLQELFTDLTADINTALGHSDQYQIFVTQKGLFDGAGGLYGPCKAQLSITASNSRIICVGPQYFAQFGDLYHPDSQSHRLISAYRAKVIDRITRRGEVWAPLRLASWQMLGGREGIATFSGNIGKVRLDRSFVTDPGAAGLSYKDDSASAVVRMVGDDGVADNQLWFELSATPTGINRRLRTAWWDGAQNRQGRTLGPRASIRDSDDAAACPATGRILYNYVCHEEVAG